MSISNYVMTIFVLIIRIFHYLSTVFFRMVFRFSHLNMKWYLFWGIEIVVWLQILIIT